MKRTFILSLAILIPLGCGVDPTEDERSISDTRSRLVVSTQPTRQAPALPTPPSSLQHYRWGTPLFPRTVTRAVMVTAPDPKDSSRFLAYGLDVRRSVSLFFVSGSYSAGHLSRLESQFLQDVVAAQGDNPTRQPATGSLGYAKGPCCAPDPPGVVPPGVWSIAQEVAGNH